MNGQNLKSSGESSLIKLSLKKFDNFVLVNVFSYVFLFLVTLYVYKDYFQLKSAPPWDFWGGYTTDAGFWWANFNLFSPVSYFPSQLFGFPSYTQPQSSAWYLPVGIVFSIFREYGPSQAAFLQGITIFFGACGVYKIASKLGIQQFISLIGGVAFLFAPGFVANAQHTDIVRGWAFLPWVLLLLMGRESSKSTILFSTLFWFTLFVGIYPGQIISYLYIAGIWFVYQNHIHKPSFDQVLAIVVPIISGFLFSLVKWIPYLLTVSPVEMFLSAEKVNLNSVLSFTFPFRDSIFPGDISMRSYFLSPIILLFVFFVKINKTSISLGFVFLISCFGSLSNNFLPLANNSRFPASDFKASLILSILLLALLGLNNLVELVNHNELNGDKRLRFQNQVICMAIFVISMITFAGATEMSSINFIIGSIGLGLSFLLISCMVMWFHKNQVKLNTNKSTTMSLAIVLLAVILSGAVAMRVAPTWNTNIASTETFLWGQDKKFTYQYKPKFHQKRPARVGPSFPISAGELLSVNWNSAKLTSDYSSGGYISYKRQPRLSQIIAIANDEKNSLGLNLLIKPSTAWLISHKSRSDLNSGRCVIENSCVQGQSDFQEWSPTSIKLLVGSKVPARLVVNEVSYLGWKAEICTKSNKCRVEDVISDSQSFYISTTIDSETKSVHFYFQTPYTKETTASGVLGLSILAGVLLYFWRKDRLDRLPVHPIENQ